MDSRAPFELFLVLKGGGGLYDPNFIGNTGFKALELEAWIQMQALPFNSWF